MKDLSETVSQMTSKDYRERFKAEYSQTKFRYERLKNYCNKIEAYQTANSSKKLGEVLNITEPPHSCSLELLRSQQRAMGEYLHVLEIRAIIEGIDLSQEG